MHMNDALTLGLESLRNRILRVYPGQIRKCLEQLTDEQIWWRPNETSNSIGNLVLHLTGSLNLYLNRLIGGIAYTRDREAEFAERRPLPKTELLALFDEMLRNGETTFGALTVERLSAPSPDAPKNVVLFEDIISIATHVSTHTGQIVWITKMLAEGSLDEVWMRTHKHLGGWRAT